MYITLLQTKLIPEKVRLQGRSAVVVIVVPAGLVLGLGASSRLGHDDLVDSQDSQRSVSSQLDRPLFSHEVVVSLDLLNRAQFMVLFNS